MAKLEEIIIRPLITEKATSQTEKFNRFGFQVALKANKHQVKQAVELLYDVKVLDVKSSIKPGKLRRMGKNVKKSPKIKKAFVKLSEGQKIEFFKGI
jgi:large subunit ribosomal protein L23